MPKRYFVSISVIALAAALATSARAQSKANATASAADTPDLSGVYDRSASVKNRMEMYFSAEEPPMLPWAQERYAANRKGANRARNEMGRPDRDPAQYPYCMPFGFPRVYGYRNAFEIVQSPGRVFVFFESGDIQRIFTDGRKHPQGPPLTFMGQSIGRWEGDTLVVDTKDMMDITWLDSMGLPHSSDLRVEQRIRKTAPDLLEMDFLFTDPKAFTKPWGGKKLFQKRPNTERNIINNVYLCEDYTTGKFSQDVLSKFKAP